MRTSQEVLQVLRLGPFMERVILCYEVKHRMSHYKPEQNPLE